MAGILLFGLFLWQRDDGVEPQRPAIAVRAIEMPNPNTSVMVFSAPEHGLTVIWVFGLDPSNDSSREPSEEVTGEWRIPSWPVSSWS
jgi:hypothetical protein